MCSTQLSRPLHTWIGFFSLFSLFFLSPDAHAQTLREWLRPDSIPEMKARFRMTDTTFLIGCYNQPEKQPSVDSMWRYLDAFGFNTTIIGWHASDIDAYLDSPYRNGKSIIANVLPLVPAAWGREIQFFLHADTSWSSNWVCKFLYRSGGAARPNSQENDWYELRANEAMYESANTTAGDTIAKWITFNWLPSQTHRYKDPGDYPDLNVQSSSEWITDRRDVNPDGLPISSIQTAVSYVVVTGHIFDDASTNSDPDNTVYLRIDVVHERPKGSSYKNSSGAPITVTADYQEQIIQTLEVTKGDLQPTTTPAVFDRYREVLFPVDMTVCADGSTGPGSAESSSKRIDLRVQWTGEGKVALRTIALRDELAELLMGQRSEDISYRQSVINSTKRQARGPDWETTTSGVRDGIIRFTLGDEPRAAEYAGYEWLNLMLRDTFNLGTSVGDSLPGYVAQTGNDWYIPRFHTATTAEEVVAQYWYPSGRPGWDYGEVASGSPFRKHIPSDGFKDYYSLPVRDLPSISEHDGGKHNIPELPLTPTGVADYTEFLQRGIIGANLPGLRDWVRDHAPDNYRYQDMIAYRLGLAAETSRNRGRRLWVVPGIANWVEVDWKIKEIQNPEASDPDTLLERVYLHSHISEPSELRLSVNLGLCYGSVGYLYWWFTNYLHVLGKTPRYHVEDTDYWAGSQESGPVSERGDYNYNVDTLRFRKDPGSANGDEIVERIPDVYLGYKNRSDELKWLNREWLPRMGVEMMRRGLRWRNAYSAHWRSLRTGTKDMFLYNRPLPSDEIITNVTARHPITGILDSGLATYVELGFFYTQPGESSNPVRDTNYVYVVNRRTFERSPDISDTSARGRLMDTLSETRTIELTLNLTNPDTSTQYNRFIRVREVAPDLAPLPLIGARQPLDTVVRYDDDGKSKVRLTLGPARAALLEITYAQPDESINDGILAHNNQRKILYSNGKYHSTYFRKVYNKDSTQWDYHVFYRQSFPVALTGTIQWEPAEWDISAEQIIGGDDPRSDNRYPSLTSRTIGPDTVVSIVWDAHPNSGSATDREILLRDVRHTFTINLSTGDSVPIVQFSPIRSVGFHDGMKPDQWGTPVINSAGFGDYVAWSDSSWGICARARQLDIAWSTWPSTPVWSGVDTVTKFLVQSVGMSPGQYPTMPPFTNRVRNDSSTGLAWQQPHYVGRPYVGIYYVRLFYTPPPGGPKVTYQELDDTMGVFMVSPNESDGETDEQHLHPSIDVTQDALGRIQEGVTWERHYWVQDKHSGGYEFITEIYLRQVVVDSTTGLPKRVGNPILKIDSWPDIDEGYGYPVISSQNQVMTLADSSATPLFSIIYREPSNIYDMAVMEGEYLSPMTPAWTTSLPRNYMYGGNYPNGAASEAQLIDRYAALYQTKKDGGSDSTLRTTRQYYSRVRPGGYMAEGLRIGARYNDVLGLGVVASLEDVWIAGNEEGQKIDMKEYGEPQNLSSLLGLLQTKCFHAEDSVEIGCRVQVSLGMPESSQLSAEELQCVVELVDSATGEVTAVLDTANVSYDQPEWYSRIDRVEDLLSGTYYVRVRVLGESLNGEMAIGEGAIPWSITPMYRYIDGSAAKRALRLDGEAGSGIRINAQPNPMTRETAVRFSIPRRDYVTVTVYDALGREVEHLVDRALYDGGRYEVEFDGASLPVGTYLVELRTSFDRAVEKVVVQR